jgi:hypothetical protein
MIRTTLAASILALSIAPAFAGVLPIQPPTSTVKVTGKAADQIEHLLDKAGVKPFIAVDLAEYNLEGLTCEFALIGLPTAHRDCEISVANGPEISLSGDDAKNLMTALGQAGVPHHQFVEGISYDFSKVTCSSGLVPSGHVCVFTPATN